MVEEDFLGTFFSFLPGDEKEEEDVEVGDKAPAAIAADDSLFGESTFNIIIINL